MKIKDVVIIGMMSAIMVAIQVAMAVLPLPNVELISLLIIVFTLVFGYKTLYIIYIFVLLEGFIYGFHLWWINYLYVWTILFIVTILFRRKSSPLFWAIVSGVYGLSFGALCSIPYFLTGGIPTGLAYWVSGIPFDIIHAISNFLVALILLRPIYKLLNILYIE
ncbi:MAG: hypothetical protein GX359_09675 [Clostridiales bacterium]|nr:hypothetical protein [Clostridiales bacterium]